MLNKKLVLAALLGAALADDPPAETPTGTPAETPTGTPAETPAPTGEENDDDDKDDRLPTRDWKEVMPDGSSDTVLCDQGESALWEDAKEKLVELATAKETTA
jgi:hypothetical protein